MISDELKAIVEELSVQGKMYFPDGASEDQILLFEENNNVTLPKKFKEWLTLSDGGECFLPAGVQFYGVAHKPVIDVNNNDRPDENYIVIGSFSFGDPILCDRNSEKIYIYDHEEGHIEEDEIYDDFFAFLKDLYTMLGIGD
jgi:hypothetical protein